ncbi:hypothetical protein E1294_24050 [Nonomuraea diastatica]|uniref:Uncharacterized protein n=1 Tax=Nonomuraea diastatica TaxID=1848329 RepID=A0A4R4WHY8_9ACTN|nr:hypothetical protein E1294_24050 [Nonomuraea diastatica]
MFDSFMYDGMMVIPADDAGTSPRGAGWAEAWRCCARPVDVPGVFDSFMFDEAAWRAGRPAM